MSNKALIDADNPEWTEEDFRRAKPAAQLPADLAAFFPKTYIAKNRRALTF